MYNNKGIMGNTLTEGTTRIDDKLNKNNKMDNKMVFLLRTIRYQLLPVL
jgi:hypothetical protein